MSKTLLTTADVPQYIKEIASRLYVTTDYKEDDPPGYTFYLYGKWKVGYESQLQSDCEKLVAWCKRFYADAYVAEKHFWYDEVSVGPYALPKQQMKKAYQIGYRNHIKLVITDPVAYRFEKDGFYRERKLSLEDQLSAASSRAATQDKYSAAPTKSHVKE